MTIRSGGIASGLDTNAIIDALVKAERAPINKLSVQKTSITTKITKIGSIKSAMSELVDAAGAVDSLNKVLAANASTSNSGVVSATASGEATPGSYSLTVQNLAVAEKDRSVAFSSADAPVKAGSLTISVQGEDDVVVDIAEGDTLVNVIDKINSSGALVSATKIYDGTSYYLDINAQNSGYDGATAADAVVLTESYTGTTGTELGLSEVRQAENAQFTFEGMAMTRKSNTLSDVVTGLTMELQAETATAVTVDVGVDADGVVANIKAFVDKFNALAGKVEGELQVAEGTDRQSSLAGDPMLRSLRSDLSSLVYTPRANAGSDPSILSSIGIKTGRDGSLEINEDKLREAIANNPNGVGRLFADSTDGLAERISVMDDRYLDYVDGIFKNREEGLQRSADNIDDQIAKMELRVKAYEQTLINQFTAMETTISNLQRQGNSLLSAFGVGGTTG